MNEEFIDIISVIMDNDLLPLDDSHISSLETLNAGMTNKNYLCTTAKGGRYVVRIPGINTSEIINRVHEWNNHHKVAPLQLNTDHINYLKDSWMKTSVFITNKFDEINDKTRQIDLICKGLKKLHYSNISFDNKFWVGDMIDLYEGVARQKEIILDKNYSELRSELKSKHDDFLYSSMDWSPCHNDLVKENILWDGVKDIYLIDWEYSGMNDPLWDLCSYILENELNDYEEQYMLKRYYSDKMPPKNMNEIITLLKIYQDVLWYVWAKIRTFHGCKYDHYAENRIDRAIKYYAAFYDNRQIRPHRQT